MSPFGSLRLRNLAAGGQFLRAMAPDAAATPSRSGAAPGIVGHASWEAFLASLTKHRRHEVRRHLRKIDRMASARVYWVHAAQDVPAVLNTLFSLHARRFRAKRQTTQFKGEELRSFHHRFAMRLHAEGRLLLGTLTVEGTPIAVAYGWHRQGRTMLFQMGIDPTAKALAPGIVLAAHVLRDQVIGAGRHALDLGEGCYGWKLAWANEVRQLIDLRRHSPRWWGTPRLVARRVARVRRAAARLVHTRVCHGQADDAPPSLARCQRAACEHAHRCAESTSSRQRVGDLD